MKNKQNTNATHSPQTSLEQHRTKSGVKKTVLCALTLAMSVAPYIALCQNFSGRITEEEMERRRQLQRGRTLAAERAYEARLTGNSNPSKNDDREIFELENNGPTNIISAQEIYWFYFRNKGEQYLEGLNEKSQILQNYLTYIKSVSLQQLDVFDKRRAIQAAKEEIKNGMSELDFNKTYSFPIYLNKMSEYNFNHHDIILFTQSNASIIGESLDFKFVGLNIYGVGNAMSLKMDEEEAERLTKKMRGKNISKSLTGVYHFKIDPKLYNTKSGKIHLTATISKMELYYLESRNNKFYFGDKVGEWTFGSTPVAHPELN